MVEWARDFCLLVGTCLLFGERLLSVFQGQPVLTANSAGRFSYPGKIKVMDIYTWLRGRSRSRLFLAMSTSIPRPLLQLDAFRHTMFLSGYHART